MRRRDSLIRDDFALIAGLIAKVEGTWVDLYYTEGRWIIRTGNQRRDHAWERFLQDNEFASSVDCLWTNGREPRSAHESFLLQRWFGDFLRSLTQQEAI